MDNLIELFFKASRQYPSHQAIIHKEDSISYSDLSQELRSTAAYLRKKGVQKGTRVMVFIPMSIKLYQTVLALFTIGAVVVFVDEWSNLARLKQALKVVEVDAIIAPRRFLWLTYLVRPFTKIRSKIWIPKVLEKIDFETEKVNENDTALITFTTGSTGLPKAANRTHAFLKEQFRVLKEEVGAEPRDRCLVTLPIVLLSILGTGASGIIADFNQKKPDLIDLNKQKDIIQKSLVSIIVASPYFLDKIADIGSNFKKVRKVITGGAPVFPNLANKITNSFSQADCIVAYGSTEAEPISIIKMQDVHLNSEGLCVGKIHDELECRIIQIKDLYLNLDDNTWEDLVCDFGEIIVAGPHVLKDYFNSPKAFKRNKIIEGEKVWHRTGDSGRKVGELLYLSGRVSQLQKRDGKYQSLFLIEYQLSSLPGVQIATLVDERICIELDDHQMKSRVMKSIENMDIAYAEIVFIKKIPRDQRHHSKIDYNKLRKLM